MNYISCTKVFDFGPLRKNNTNIYADYWNQGDGKFEVDDDSFSISDARIYIVPEGCWNGGFVPYGNYISFDVDLSQMDGKTQGNLYLTGPGGTSGGSHGQTHGAGQPYYCDANKDKSQAQTWCPEIDLFEANLCGFHTTWHGCDSIGPSDSNIGCDGDGKAGGGGNTSSSGFVPFSNGDYNKVINSASPFTIIVGFPEKNTPVMWVKLIQGNKYIYLENDYGTTKPSLFDQLKMGWTLTSSNWMNQDKSPLDWLNGTCVQGSPGNRVFTLSKMYYNKIPSSWTSPKDMVPGLPPAPPSPPPVPRPPGPSPPGPHSGLGLLQILGIIAIIVCISLIIIAIIKSHRNKK
jgi:hypothetical protein